MPKIKLTKITKIFIFILLLIFVFWAGFYTGSYLLSPEKFLKFNNQFFSSNNISILWDVWRILESKYIEKEKIDIQKAFYGALNGLVKSVGDDYTEFYSPEEAKIFNEDVSGSFEGVGMEITIKKGLVTVVAPLEDTPAWRAGIKAGDVILKINGEDATNLKLQEAVKKIRGPKGTKVTLTIIRDEFKEPKDFVIVRDVIVVHSVKTKMLDSNIGYLKIINFGGNSVSEFTQGVVNLLNQGAEKLIVDLRNNPGGFLESAVIIAGWFLPKGKIVVKEDFGKDKTQRIHFSQGPGILSNYPTVVLINQGSASASEILAAALKENLGFKLIGQKTFGKGSVQQIFNLADGSLVKVTVARWLTPQNNLIEGQGVEPDIKVEEKENEDKALEKAIEILKKF